MGLGHRLVIADEDQDLRHLEMVALIFGGDLHLMTEGVDLLKRVGIELIQ